MKTQIYYFTGTGNSLAIAKELCNRLNECELISIPHELKQNRIVSDSEKVGFIFPLHYAGLPKIVFDFMNKIDVSNSDYFFSIITYAGQTTYWPLIQLDQFFCSVIVDCTSL